MPRLPIAARNSEALHLVTRPSGEATNLRDPRSRIYPNWQFKTIEVPSSPRRTGSTSPPSSMSLRRDSFRRDSTAGSPSPSSRTSFRRDSNLSRQGKSTLDSPEACSLGSPISQVPLPPVFRRRMTNSRLQAYPRHPSLRLALELDLASPRNSESESLRTSADLDREFNALFDRAFSSESPKNSSQDVFGPTTPMASALRDVSNPVNGWESEASVAMSEQELDEPILSSADVLTSESEDPMCVVNSAGTLQVKVSNFDGLRRRLEAKIFAVRALQVPQLFKEGAAIARD